MPQLKISSPCSVVFPSIRDNVTVLVTYLVSKWILGWRPFHVSRPYFLFSLSGISDTASGTVSPVNTGKPYLYFNNCTTQILLFCTKTKKFIINLHIITLLLNVSRSLIIFQLLLHLLVNVQTKLHGLSPRANYTDRAAAAGRRS
jgi:hypothetical protein